MWWILMSGTPVPRLVRHRPFNIMGGGDGKSIEQLLNVLIKSEDGDVVDSNEWHSSAKVG